MNIRGRRSTHTHTRTERMNANGETSFVTDIATVSIVHGIVLHFTLELISMHTRFIFMHVLLLCRVSLELRAFIFFLCVVQKERRKRERGRSECVAHWVALLVVWFIFFYYLAAAINSSSFTFCGRQMTSVAMQRKQLFDTNSHRPLIMKLRHFMIVELLPIYCYCPSEGNRMPLFFFCGLHTILCYSQRSNQSVEITDYSLQSHQPYHISYIISICSKKKMRNPSSPTRSGSAVF